MNDFLGNLLARSVQTPTGVRPRLATRFEPPPMAQAELETAARPTPPVEAPDERLPAPQNRAGPERDEPFRAPQLPIPARAGTLETREAARPAPPSQVPATLPALTASPAAVETGEPAFHSPPRPLLAAAGPVITRAASGRELPFPPQAAERAAEREQPQPEASAAPREIFSERVILNREVVRDVPLASLLWSPGDDPPSGETTPAPAGRSAEPSGPPPNPLETIRTTRTSPPVRPISQAVGPDAPGLPASLPAGPTIEVTIGRIEVRATPPPAQAARERKPHPALSLEEYMRQRNGGKG